MDYRAQGFIGTTPADAKLKCEFDSKNFEGTHRSNAMETCKLYLLGELKVPGNDFAAMHFVNYDGSDIDNREPLAWGAFTHPLRGRIVFSSGYTSGHASALKEEMEFADKPFYSPNQLYAMKPVSVVTRYIMSNVVQHWMKDEFGLYESSYKDGFHEAMEKAEDTKRIEIRYLADIGFGSDESWSVGTLWFDGKPVAVLTYYGENEDYDAYVTHDATLRAMVEWVRSLVPDNPYETPSLVDPDKPLEIYTEFNRHTLHDFYDVEKQEPKPPPNPGKNYPWWPYFRG